MNFGEKSSRQDRNAFDLDIGGEGQLLRSDAATYPKLLLAKKGKSNKVGIETGDGQWNL